MIAGLFIGIVALIIGAISGALAKTNRTVYDNEEDKQDLALRYAQQKYGDTKEYEYNGKTWEVSDIGVGYPNKEGTPILLDIKRGVWPINDNSDVVIVETLSDEVLTEMLYKENEGVNQDLLNKATKL